MPTQNVEINDKIEVLIDAGVGNAAVIPVSSANCTITPFATQTSPFTFIIKDFSGSSYTADFTNESGDTIQFSGTVSASGNWFTDDEQYEMKATYGTKSVTKKYNISKVKEGGTGTGVSARSVSITAPTQAIAYDSTGKTPTPGAAFNLTATVVNSSGTVYYEWIVDGVSQQNTTTNTYSYTPPVGTGGLTGYYELPDVVTVKIRENSASSAVLGSDVFTIYGVLEGSNSISAFLSNQAHIFPTDELGTATGTIPGSGTFVTVFDGITELDYDGVGTAAGKYKVTAVADNSAITVSTPTDAGLKASYGDHSAMTASSETITYTIDGVDFNSEAFSIAVTQSIAKGLAGAKSRTVSITSPTQAIVYDSSGANPTPSGAFTLTAGVSNTIGTPYYDWLLDGVSQQNTTTNTYSYTPDASYSNMPDVITVRLREDANNNPILASDVFTIYGVLEGGSGVDAISVLLSNEAHVFPTDSAGTATGTITGSGTFITVFEGATELDYDGTGTAAGNWTVSAAADNSGIAVGSVSEATLKAQYADHSNLTIDIETITYTITGKTLAGDSFTILKQQSIAKGKGGTNGVDGKKVQTGLVYYGTSTTSPGDPSASGTATYTFSTDTFTGLAANWSPDKPTITASQVNNYWQRRYVAVENTAGSGVANENQANLTFPGTTVKFQDGFGDSVTQDVDDINAEAFKWIGANTMAFNYDGTYYQPRASSNWAYTYNSTAGDKEYTQGSDTGGNTYPWISTLHTFYKGNTAVAEIRLRHIGRPGSETTTATYEAFLARSVYYDFDVIGTPGSIYSTESNYVVTINGTSHTSAFNGGTAGPTSNGFDQIQNFDGASSSYYVITIQHTPSKSITTLTVAMQTIADAAPINPGSVK